MGTSGSFITAVIMALSSPKNRRRNILYLGAAIAIGACSIPLEAEASAAPKSTKRFEPPYPFDAQQLTNQLLSVASIGDKPFSRAAIENIFSVTLLPLPPFRNGKVSTFAVRSRVSWYFDLSVGADSSNPVFIFEWGQTPGTPYQPFPKYTGNICVKPSQIILGVARLGWKASGERDQPFVPYEYRFSYGSAKIVMQFDSRLGCLLNYTLDHLS
jgi:hypothetical protein